MLRKAKQCDLYEVVGKDAYGQANEPTLVKTVDVFISELTHTVDAQNPKYAKSTHLGLTLDRTITMGNLIKLDGNEYNVDYAIHDARVSQLFLKKV